jgi:hypothetical protein
MRPVIDEGRASLRNLRATFSGMDELEHQTIGAHPTVRSRNQRGTEVDLIV